MRALMRFLRLCCECHVDYHELGVIIMVNTQFECHITSHHITSHHITSDHITSHHITSYLNLPQQQGAVDALNGGLGSYPVASNRVCRRFAARHQLQRRLARACVHGVKQHRDRGKA